jgi:DNA polymerase-3 subunit delta'
MLDFNQIIGHEKVKKHLKKAVAMNKVSHAYIFSGEDGTGKNMLAEAFSLLLQCEGRLEMDNKEEPCHTCKSCLQAKSNNHPDIIRITHEKASIGVDDIRIQMNNDIQIKPYSSPYKIYIIDEAEKLTEQAQNALLKTIEEPPSYGIILLLTNNLNILLPTILSRCVTLKLQPVDKDLIKDYLMINHQIPDYLAELSQLFSGGNVGKAIKYASSEEFTKMKEEALHILKYIEEMKIYEIMDEIKKLSEHKEQITEYLDFFILWYRDVLLYKATKEVNLLTYKSELQEIMKQSNKKSYEAVQNILNAIDKAKLRLKANVNSDIALELMLLTIQED